MDTLEPLQGNLSHIFKFINDVYNLKNLHCCTKNEVANRRMNVKELDEFGMNFGRV